MQTHRAVTRGGQGWLGVVAALAIAGCGGQASGSNPNGEDKTANQGVTSGTAGVADEPTITTGGTGSSNGSIDQGPPPGSSGSYAIGGAPSGPVCPASELFARVSVTPLDGASLEGTNGKARVTVRLVEEDDSPNEAAPVDLRDRSYVLHGPTQDWRVDATIPGLKGDLIKVGDELDFQLQTSIGHVPFSTVTNFAFGLFTPEGELLLFGAETTNYEPVADLAFLGLQMSDGGTSCQGSGLPCSYDRHGAHFSAPNGALDLEPGHSGQLEKLVIGLQEFSGPGYGNCDNSGHSVVVGLKATTD